MPSLIFRMLCARLRRDQRHSASLPFCDNAFRHCVLTICWCRKVALHAYQTLSALTWENLMQMQTARNLGSRLIDLEHEGLDQDTPEQKITTQRTGEEGTECRNSMSGEAYLSQ